MMLQGTQWHRGSLVVAAPPTIWKLTDTDDDGVADERKVWFTAGLGGCGTEVRGPCLGREQGVLNGHERTGDLPPPLLSMGPAAPCGTRLVASGSGL